MMEIYRATASFRAPAKAGNRNVLSFEKADKFELLEGEDKSKIWWAARCLRTNDVGYVPANYLKFEERKVGKLLPDNYKAQREQHLNTLKEIQKQQNNAHPEHSFPNIPEPDYQKDDEPTNGQQDSTSPTTSKPQGLIEPKKLRNPNLESREKMDLHKELLYNSKMGIDILNQKSEFKRELEKRREKQHARDKEEYLRSKRTSFDLQLQKQADKIKEQEEHHDQQAEEESKKPEFFKIHARIRSTKVPSTEAKSWHARKNEPKQ